MTKLLKSICMAALLCAGTAYAQTSSQPTQNPSDNPDNPHSTKAKDKQSSDPGNTDQQTQQAETANPHSPDYNRADKPSGQAAQTEMKKADAENPNDINYKNRRANEGMSASAGSSDMSNMDHGQMAMDREMMQNPTPQMVLQRLHLANQEEIKMGQLAEKNGSDRIKSYAKTLEQDHKMADDQVKQLAKQKNVTLSDQPKNPEMKQHMQHMEDRFSSMKGAQFDRAFTNMMANQHKHLISMAQSWEQKAQDPDVKNLLEQMLPKLQQHAQMADQLKTPSAQGRTPEPQNR